MVVYLILREWLIVILIIMLDKIRNNIICVVGFVGNLNIRKWIILKVLKVMKGLFI